MKHWLGNVQANGNQQLGIETILVFMMRVLEKSHELTAEVEGSPELIPLGLCTGIGTLMLPIYKIKENS